MKSFFLLTGGFMGYSILPHHPGVHHREHYCHLDYSCPQAHENCNQLFHRQPGLLWCFHGVIQHTFQLCLCSSQWLVFWAGLLSLPELLPHHSHVFLHILHGRHCCGQVSKAAALVDLAINLNPSASGKLFSKSNSIHMGWQSLPPCLEAAHGVRKLLAAVQESDSVRKKKISTLLRLLYMGLS